jgi:hypothetical protein
MSRTLTVGRWERLRWLAEEIDRHEKNLAILRQEFFELSGVKVGEDGPPNHLPAFVPWRQLQQNLSVRELLAAQSIIKGLLDNQPAGKKVLLLFGANPDKEWSVVQVTEELGLPMSKIPSIRTMLSRMVKLEQVESAGRGRYKAKKL